MEWNKLDKRIECTNRRKEQTDVMEWNKEWEKRMKLRNVIRK